MSDANVIVSFFGGGTRAATFSFGVREELRHSEATGNGLPTCIELTHEQVDRLRAATGEILRDSPEFHRLGRDLEAEAGATAAAGGRSVASTAPPRRPGTQLFRCGLHSTRLAGSS